MRWEPTWPSAGGLQYDTGPDCRCHGICGPGGEGVTSSRAHVFVAAASCRSSFAVLAGRVLHRHVPTSSWLRHPAAVRLRSWRGGRYIVTCPRLRGCGILPQFGGWKPPPLRSPPRAARLAGLGRRWYTCTGRVPCRRERDGRSARRRCQEGHKHLSPGRCPRWYTHLVWNRPGRVRAGSYGKWKPARGVRKTPKRLKESQRDSKDQRDLKDQWDGSGTFLRPLGPLGPFPCGQRS